jgi:hypothetical protein
LTKVSPGEITPLTPYKSIIRGEHPWNTYQIKKVLMTNSGHFCLPFQLITQSADNITC